MTVLFTEWSTTCLWWKLQRMKPLEPQVWNRNKCLGVESVTLLPTARAHAYVKNAFIRTCATTDKGVEWWSFFTTSAIFFCVCVFLSEAPWARVHKTNRICISVNTEKLTNTWVEARDFASWFSSLGISSVLLSTESPVCQSGISSAFRECFPINVP